MLRFAGPTASVNAASGIIISLSLVVKRPHRIIWFTYQQSVAQAGSESVDLLISGDTTTDVAAGLRDRALGGGTAGTGAFRPSNIPTTIRPNLPIRAWFTQYKALFRNAGVPAIIQAINFGVELM